MKDVYFICSRLNGVNLALDGAAAGVFTGLYKNINAMNSPENFPNLLFTLAITSCGGSNAKFTAPETVLPAEQVLASLRNEKGREIKRVEQSFFSEMLSYMPYKIMRTFLFGYYTTISLDGISELVGETKESLRAQLEEGYAFLYMQTQRAKILNVDFDVYLDSLADVFTALSSAIFVPDSVYEVLSEGVGFTVLPDRSYENTEPDDEIDKMTNDVDDTAQPVSDLPEESDSDEEIADETQEVPDEESQITAGQANENEDETEPAGEDLTDGDKNDGENTDSGEDAAENDSKSDDEAVVADEVAEKPDGENTKAGGKDALPEPKEDPEHKKLRIKNLILQFVVAIIVVVIIVLIWSAARNDGDSADTDTATLEYGVTEEADSESE